MLDLTVLVPSRSLPPMLAAAGRGDNPKVDCNPGRTAGAVTRDATGQEDR
jgi:hypothetical protein